MFITPFLTTILGFLLAGEVPDRSTLYGGVIILAGVYIFNFGGRLFDKTYQSESHKQSGLRQSP
jgi:drug/metabolite transporter (DMT)-like permease